MGIPADVHPSRATLYRIAEQMGVDYVVLGQYAFDGRTFAATAQLLDMKRQRLSPPATESGPLIELIDVQTLLAWDLLHALRPGFSISRESFRAGAAPVRLDALENYVRGMIASTPEEKIQKFKEAVRINPGYAQASLQLGRTYYAERQYDFAVSALQKIPRSDSLAREASFFLGLAAYYQGDYPTSKSAFDFLASQIPLTEVYNNLGVLAYRTGDKSALQYFQRAVQADPNDADYHFNLGLAHLRSGNLTEAVRHVREASNLRPNDTETKAFVGTLQAGMNGSKPPAPRIKRNYDESSFRQVALEIEAEAEKNLAADPHSHAQFHVTRGHELLGQGFVLEAEREFREAALLDNFNAEAHAGLASSLEAKQDTTGARSEAQAALRIRTFAEPLLVLARLDLSENKVEAASQGVDRVLQLDPANGPAVALKRAIAAKLAQKAQPLLNP
jgi:tetratricopeptide (TPR) repeat protein